MSAPVDGRTLRIATLNLWGLREPLERRLAVAAEGLAALAPDVVALQEVCALDGGASTAERLARALGLELVWAPATRGPAGLWGPGSPAGEEGLALLARHPVVASRHVELPDARPDERRILLSARLEVAGAPVWCHTTHLHWRPGDGLARERQVLALDEAVRDVGDSDALHVLAGDLNASPDCDEIRFLCGRHTLAGRRTVWQDAFARARPFEAGWTWASRNPCTEWLRWLERDRRIDYVLVSPERRSGRGRILDARVILDTPADDGTWASDHFGVTADVLV